MSLEDTFREEADELLVDLEAAMLELEETPDDSDCVDRAFRAMHTIKGSGAMFGFDKLAAFTHHLENAFDLVRSGDQYHKGSDQYRSRFRRSHPCHVGRPEPRSRSGSR